MEKGTLKDMIAKTELSAKIAQIALSCNSCNGPVRNAIQEYQNNHNHNHNLSQQNNNNSETRHQDGGRSSLAATNDIQDGFATEAVNPNDCKYHTQQYT
jgi:TolA-binding protein